MREELPSPDLLLAHADWVRALARRLVHGDEHLAEDVAQEAWMAALASGRTRDLPAWLVGVVRNLSRRALRSRERRRRRELEGRPAASPLLPDEILEREQTRRVLVEAVLALEEPYRSTLLMRYYEELGAAEIARRVGVPAATVRTRIKRGLERLRWALEARSGGGLDRLAGLAGIGRLAGGTTPAAPAWNGWTLTGGALLSSKTAAWLAAASILILCLWLAVQVVLEPRAPAEIAALEPAPAPVEETGAAAPTTIAAAGREIPEAEPAAEAPPSDDVWRLAIVRRTGHLTGLVVDAASQEPLGGVELAVTLSTGPLPQGLALAEDRAPRTVRAVTDAAGAFDPGELPCGPYRVHWSDPSGRSGHLLLVVPAGKEFVRLDLGDIDPHRPGKDLLVAVEDARGDPVPGARVWLRGWGSANGPLELVQACDAEGFARFADAWLESGILLAAADGGAARVDLAFADSVRRRLSLVADAAGAPIEVIRMVLGPCARLEGRLRPSVPGAVVNAWARPAPGRSEPFPPMARRAAVGEEGAFAFPALPPGCYAITVEGATGLRLMPPRVAGGPGEGAPEPGAVEIELESGESRRIELDLAPAPRLDGLVVHAAEGTPVAGALVRATAAPAAGTVMRGVPVWFMDSRRGDDAVHPGFARTTRTDPQGRYRLEGLQPGVPLRVEVLAPALALDRVEGVRLSAEETRALIHALEPAGGVQGVTRSSMTVGLRRAGARELALVLATSREPTAAFTVPGLAAGEWEALAVHSSEEIAPVVLARFEVRAGALTWLDLRDAAPHQAHGRVLLRGAPLPGAVLDFFWGQLVTDEEGRFALAHAFRHEGTRTFRVCAPVADAVPLRFEVPGMASARVPWRGDLELPEGSLEVVLSDATGGRVTGRVTLRPADSLSGLDAPVPLREPTGPAPVAIKLHWRPITRAADAVGRARFELLPPGSFHVSAVLDSGDVLAPVEIELAANEARTVELAPAAGGALDVLLQEPDGRPIPGAEIHVWRQGEAVYQLLTSLRTDLMGRAHWEHLPAGEVRVDVEAAFGSGGKAGGTAVIRSGETVELLLTVPRERR